MQEIKKIVCSNTYGDILWEGVLLPLRNGNFEGFIHDSTIITYINFDYLKCDVLMTIKRKPLDDDTCNCNVYELALVNKMGIFEWFTTSDRNKIICTEELVSNNVAKTYKKQIDSNKQVIS